MTSVCPLLCSNSGASLVSGAVREPPATTLSSAALSPAIGDSISAAAVSKGFFMRPPSIVAPGLDAADDILKVVS